MTLARSTAVLLAALAPLACGSGLAVTEGPNDTLRAYALALEQGRVDDAYRLLSQEAKRSMGLEAFRRAVRDNPEDVKEIARAISRPASDPVVTATLTMPDGEELLLVYEGNRWRIDAAAVDLYGQATPRQAIAGLLRAYERKRYDVILRYMPDSEKEDDGMLAAPAAPAERPDAGAAAPAAEPGAAPPGPRPASAAALTAEKLRAAWEGPQKEGIARVTRAIRAALPNATIEETGDSASMAYGGGTVALVREHGVWKIKDF